MNEQKIHYEPHPVSPERKAELRAQGLTIVDDIYRPKDAPAEPAKPETGGEPQGAVANTMPPDGMQFTESSTAALAPTESTATNTDAATAAPVQAANTPRKGSRSAK
jgi:hypothetical protein